MGDKITQPVQSPEVLRAKFLKAALHSGRRSLSHPPSPEIESPAGTEKQTWLEDPPEVQRACFERLLESAPEAISILDPRHRVRRVNTEFTRLFGFTAEEAVGREIEWLIVPPDRAHESVAMAKAVRDGQKVTLETRRRRKDGTLVDVSIVVTPVKLEGTTVVLYAIYRDISERKRAEGLSLALYRMVEETSSSEGLKEFYVSIHGIVSELMSARNFYIALHDQASQHLTFPYFVDERDPAPLPRKLSRGLTEYVLRTGEPLLATPAVFDELVHRGEVDSIGAPSIDWLGVPLKSAGTCFGVVAVQSYSDAIRYGEKDKGILTFVSQQLANAIEHKRAEEALRRSEARYRSLVESAVYGIYRSSLDGRFLDLNPALVMMLGYQSPAEVLALDPQKDVFINPDEQARLVRECRNKGRLDNFEIKWKRKDGNAITVRLSGRTVAREVESDEILEVIAEDVTEKRVLEDQFRQAQKMEAVGRLAGGVAHDFNNLLMVISGYTEVLLERLEPGGSLTQRVEAIQQAADRATTLTRQLLAFSRKQLLELKVVDVNTIVSDMERLLRPLIGENIELTTRLGASLGRTRADAGQLEQVIMNLVVNAKDAMPAGGKIRIQTANAVLDDSYRREHTYIRPGPYVMLSVSDTGVGMDKETRSRIFEPFFTTKEKGKGTGLGLSTVYGIVKQSGGYIFAHSEVGQGTTFRIYLPRVEDAAEPADAVNHSGAGAHGSETVLLVEDEESVRALVRETLEARGYTVLEAENGETALQIVSASTKQIDLLITDVVMPGMSGRELASQLARSHPQTRVLFLSGYTEDAIIHEGGLEPGTAFLQKPFTLQNLSRRVRDVLQSEHK
jgi:two-component system, cell cycle sensor histidine kinase and response regulator CckA